MPNEQLETRLLVLSELLGKAVAELARVITDIKGEVPAEPEDKAGGTDG